MFDGSLPEAEALTAIDDATLSQAITGWARTAAAADARRLEAIAELQRRRCHDDDDRNLWPCDPTDAAAAEIAAALTIGHQRALRELDLSTVLRDRLPQVNTVFKTGALTAHLIAKIAWRTMLITDPQIIARVDTELAATATSWGPLSDYKLIQAVDLIVAHHDPAAVWRTRTAARSRTVTIGDPNDSDGTVSFWGTLLATDGSLLDKRLTAMAHSVCTHDPRTHDQRRADALGALAAGSFHLTCTCTTPTCPAAATDDGRASSITIHIVADPTALHTPPDPTIHGPGPHPTPPPPNDPDPDPGPGPGPEPAPEADPEPEGEAATESAEPAPADSTPAPGGEALPQPAATPHRAAEPAPSVATTTSTPPAQPPPVNPKPPPPPPRQPAGVIVGGAILPAPLLAELITHGAKIQHLTPPQEPPEPRYRPTPALTNFIHTRDLTCRYPGCDRPADTTDIDHTTAWPTGPTHPSNTKCYCRKHHLLKTFWTGPGGWSDHQHPDATITITTPAGLTYTTHPLTAILFPHWNPTTPAHTHPGTTKPKPPGNHLDTFKRKRTRIQDRQHRIHTERQRNTTWLAEHQPNW